MPNSCPSAETPVEAPESGSVGRSRPARKWPWFALLRLFGIILFVVVMMRADVRSIWARLSDAKVALVAGAVVFQIGILLSKGVRWHVLSDGTPACVPMARSVGQFMESYALGIITPGRLGEFLRAGHAARAGKSVLRAGINVLAERGMDVGLFVAAAGGAIVSGYFRGAGEAFGMAVVLAGAAIVVVACVLVSSHRFSERMQRLLRMKPKESPSQPSSQGLLSVAGLAAVLMLTFVGVGCYFFSCYLLARGVGLDTSFVVIAGAVAMAGMLTMLPITIMGMGTREVALVYVLGSHPEAQVLAFSGLVFLVAQLGGGLMSLMMGHAALLLSRDAAHSASCRTERSR